MTNSPSAQRKTSLLFLDDDPRMQSWLRRELRGIRNEWKFQICNDPHEALSILQEEEIDVVISDIQIPGMSGVQFLKKVKELHPFTLRVIFSGTSDQRSYVEAMGIAHQFISKPISWEDFYNIITQVIRLSCRVRWKRLRELEIDVDSIPVLPDLYLKVREAAADPEVSAHEIGTMIARDFGMSSRILQLVNSAYFGFKQKINDPVNATIILGIETVKTLILTFHLFGDTRLPPLRYLNLNQLRDHSLLVGGVAREFANNLNLPRTQRGLIFTLGFMHDVGKIVMALRFATKYDKIAWQSIKENRPLYELEEEHFQLTHQEVGAFMLNLWGFKSSSIEAVYQHHNLNRSIGLESPDLGNLLYLANHTAHAIERGSVAMLPEEVRQFLDYHDIDLGDLKGLNQQNIFTE